jgi:hypothetical protein
MARVVNSLRRPGSVPTSLHSWASNSPYCAKRTSLLGVLVGAGRNAGDRFGCLRPVTGTQKSRVRPLIVPIPVR